jgi:glycosyltransferase involved in cell wall biosynthesis
VRYFVASNIPRLRTTGMGRQMFGMAEALAARGHDARLVFRDDLDLRLGLKMSRLEFPVRLAARVARLADGPAVAVVHEPSAWALALVGRARPVKTIAMVHNAEIKVWRKQDDLARYGGAKRRLSSRVLWPLTELSQAWLSLRAAHHVFTLSSEDRRFIVDELGVPEARVTRIDNGVEPAFFASLPAAPVRDRDLLFLASWLPHKGTAIFTAALAALAAELPHLTLTVAGAGVPEAQVRADLPEPWRTRAEIIPSMPAESLPALYSRHRIFVLPSFYEGIPLSLLEAMAAGLAPLASAVGGIVDVAEAPRESVLVPAGDVEALAAALRRLARDPAEVRRLGAAAAAKARTLTWDRVAGQVEAVATAL